MTKGFSDRNRVFSVSNNRMFRLGAGWSGVRFPTGIKKFSTLRNFQSGTVSYPTPYSENRGIFLPNEKGARNVDLTTPLQLVPILRMSGAMPQLPYMPSFLSIEKFIVYVVRVADLTQQKIFPNSHLYLNIKCRTSFHSLTRDKLLCDLKRIEFAVGITRLAPYLLHGAESFLRS